MYVESMRLERKIIMNPKIGVKIRELRESLGMSQDDVRSFLGLNSKNTIGKWERDESEVKFEYLIKLAQLGNVDINYFFCEDSDKICCSAKVLSAEVQERIVEKIIKDMEYEDILKTTIKNETVERLNKSLNRFLNTLEK
jgi:transcriptional regulator with XRE-family HTH domain